MNSRSPDNACADAFFHLDKSPCVRCKGMQHDLRVHFGAWQNKQNEAQIGDIRVAVCSANPCSPFLLSNFLTIPLWTLCSSAWSSQIPPPRHSFVCGWKVQWACVSPKGADEGVTSTRWSGIWGEAAVLFSVMRATVRGSGLLWSPVRRNNKGQCRRQLFSNWSVHKPATPVIPFPKPWGGRWETPSGVLVLLQRHQRVWSNAQ